MSTVQQLISKIDRLYVGASTDTDKVSFMNEAIDKLSPYFDNTIRATITTVADTDHYALPSDCTDVSQIVALGVSKNLTIDDRYDYYYYKKATMFDYPRDRNGYYQDVSTTGVKSLVLYPAPTTSGYTISILFEKPMVNLSATALTESPEFDSKYHILLVYWACKMLASAGSAMDTTQADMFTKLWDDGLNELYAKRTHENLSHPKRRKDNIQWHNGRRYVGGGV